MDVLTAVVIPDAIRLPILYALKDSFCWANYTDCRANISVLSSARHWLVATLWSKWSTFCMRLWASASTLDSFYHQSVSWTCSSPRADFSSISYLFFLVWSILSGQKRNSRLGADSGQVGMSYAPNFSSPRTIEGHVINCIFKPFVTRLTASLKFLKSSENVVSCTILSRFLWHCWLNLTLLSGPLLWRTPVTSLH